MHKYIKLYKTKDKCHLINLYNLPQHSPILLELYKNWIENTNNVDKFPIIKVPISNKSIEIISKYTNFGYLRLIHPNMDELNGIVNETLRNNKNSICSEISKHKHHILIKDGHNIINETLYYLGYKVNISLVWTQEYLLTKYKINNRIPLVYLLTYNEIRNIMIGYRYLTYNIEIINNTINDFEKNELEYNIMSGINRTNLAMNIYNPDLVCAIFPIVTDYIVFFTKKKENGFTPCVKVDDYTYITRNLVIVLDVIDRGFHSHIPIFQQCVEFNENDDRYFILTPLYLYSLISHLYPIDTNKYTNQNKQGFLYRMLTMGIQQNSSINTICSEDSNNTPNLYSSGELQTDFDKYKNGYVMIKL